MSQHRPTLVPTIFALFSLAASCAVSAGALHAAECIAKPDKPPPQGEHWYYRIDRATNRQCWYLGPGGASVQKSATQEPASDALALPATPQPAQRPTAPAPTAAPAAAEANVPAPAAPPPWPEAAKLPDVPPTFEPAHRRSPSGRDRSMRSTPRRRQRAILPRSRNRLQTRDLHPLLHPKDGDADHTLALAMIALAVLAISGTMFHATRWLSLAQSQQPTRWPHPSTLNTPYPRAPTPLDFDSGTPGRHIPLPKPLDQTERLAQALQQLLHELQTKHVLPPGPSTLSRSSWPPVATATRSDHINIRAS